MRARSLLISIVTLTALIGLGPAQSATAKVKVTKTTLHFRVVIGPNNEQVCDIIGDLYRPSTATRAHPAPAILATNGFGGSKDDQAYLGQVGAERGYVVLSYSGLGFGGSGCRITLDDPDWDGKAGSQLVGFLGGANGVAFTDAGHTKPYPVIDYVRRDTEAHDGRRHPNDPRIGMVGGSYGGGIQFATASVDPRLDTIVPLVTWNDLTYSLTPNNTDFVRGVTSGTPGVPKFEWTSLFFAAGIADGVEGAQTDPSRIQGCPNFTNQVCTSFATSAALGYPDAATIELLRHASVASYISRIRIPTFLIQGEADSLFNLQEAIATYRALRAQHVPVRMIWQSWGHSGSTAAPGEFASDETVFQTYEGQRVLAWFEHYLKDRNVSLGPNFAYYRDWIPYEGHGPNDEQYGTAKAYPVGKAQTWFLSGSDGLVKSRSGVQTGAARYLGTAAPTSYSETSGVQSESPNDLPPPTDVPGTFVAYSSEPLARSIDVVGVPTATLRLSAPAQALTQSLGPSGMLLLFAKIYDVGPDGTVSLVNRLVSPVRAEDVTKPVHVELPGIVHRFDKGHRIQLVIAASDLAYETSRVSSPVTVLTSRPTPSMVTLPVVA